MEDRKVLVTGCAGFIGSTLAEKLIERGYEVIGVDCFTPYYSTAIKHYNLRSLLKSERFSFLELDLSETSFDDLVSVVKRATYILHEAAQPGVRSSWGADFDAYVKHNILASQKLLEAVLSAGSVKRFVYASSSSIYGNVENIPISEDAIPKPYSPYGVTKLTAENLCRVYYENFDVPIVILRYFTVYGPRQRPDMAFHKFIKSMLKSEPIYVYGDGQQARDFTYIEDIVEATIRSIECEDDIIGQAINVGYGRPVKLMDAIEIIAELCNAKPQIMFKEEMKGDVKATWADISKARKLLGWQPRTKLRDGLEAEIRWINQAIEIGLI
jgi:UDP-glucose 4-epimerase